MRAERKSPQTVDVYRDGVLSFLRWCAEAGRPARLDRPSVNGFIAALLERGAQPATARSRQLAVRRFSAWLLEEGEFSEDPLVGLKAPKVDSRIIQPLTDAQLRALIEAWKGREMRDRRDEAIVRFMVETGARAGEVVALQKSDVDLQAGRRAHPAGQRRQGPAVPYGPQTTRALDRYLRVRSTHRLADSPGFWLGDRGKAFGYDALHKTLALRAERADVDGFHPHLLRHTAAHRWLAAGGSDALDVRQAILLEFYARLEREGISLARPPGYGPAATAKA